MRTRGVKRSRKSFRKLADEDHSDVYMEDSDVEIDLIAESSCSPTRPSRQKKLPMRYQTISDSSTKSELDEEDWECKECGSTDGNASDNCIIVQGRSKISILNGFVINL